MEKVLNIPTRLLKAYKGDKRTFELLAAAVLLKINHSHSVVKTATASTLRQELHCKHSVAQRILEGAKDCELFIYNKQKKVLFVKTFKDNTTKDFGKGKMRFKGSSDFCKKVKKDKYTLRQIKRILREALLENMIRGKQMKQLDSWGLATKELKNGCVTTAKKCAMTQKMLASGFGLGRSSANRYVNRMKDAGVVSKTQIVAECAIPNLNDVTLKEWMDKNPDKAIHAWHDVENGGWSGWAYYGCMYSITDRNIEESFKHVIWNHAKRVDAKKTLSKKSQSGLSYIDFMSTPDGEGYWSKFS